MSEEEALRLLDLEFARYRELIDVDLERLEKRVTDLERALFAQTSAGYVRKKPPGKG